MYIECLYINFTLLLANKYFEFSLKNMITLEFQGPKAQKILAPEEGFLALLVRLFALLKFIHFHQHILHNVQKMFVQLPLLYKIFVPKGQTICLYV